MEVPPQTAGADRLHQQEQDPPMTTSVPLPSKCQRCPLLGTIRSSWGMSQACGRSSAFTLSCHPESTFPSV